MQLSQNATNGAEEPRDHFVKSFIKRLHSEESDRRRNVYKIDSAHRTMR